MLYHFVSEHWIAEPPDRIFHFFADPDNLPRIMRPSQQARIERVELVPPPPHDRQPVEALAGTGSELYLSFRAVPWHSARILWHARIVEFEWNRYFRDVQVEGPMNYWTHRHEVEPSTCDGRDGTLVRDLVEYDPGFGVLGALGDALFIRHALRTVFNYRQQALKRLLVPPQVSENLRKLGEQLRRLSK